MARHTFFSFYYADDVMRAQIVKNAWVTQNRVDAGFFDKSAFEKAKIESPENLKRFLTSKLEGTSVTCVCVGAKTYLRPWVRYEIVRSVQQGKGILCVRLDRVPCAQKIRSGLPGLEASGPNPFDYLCLRRADGRVHWSEWRNSSWQPYTEVPSAWESDLPYDFGSGQALQFSKLFAVHHYNPASDQLNLGQWIEAAARNAGR